MVVERKRKIKSHAKFMLAAVVLNLASFAVVMGPAWDNVGEGTSSSIGLIEMGHVGFGALAFLLSFWLVGVWLVSPWLARPLKIYCYGNLKKTDVDCLDSMVYIVDFRRFLICHG